MTPADENPEVVVGSLPSAELARVVAATLRSEGVDVRVLRAESGTGTRLAVPRAHVAKAREILGFLKSQTP